MYAAGFAPLATQVTVITPPSATEPPPETEDGGAPWENNVHECNMNNT